MLVRLVAFIVLYGAMLQAAEIKGTVRNAVGGELLARVAVSVLEAVRDATTPADGTVAIEVLRQFL